MSYQDYLRDAEYFCEQAEQAPLPDSQVAVRFSTASILFSFIAIESLINNMMSDFASLPQDMFTLHEQGFLVERAVAFSGSGANAGTFEVTNRPEYKRLEDKILFLLARFSGDSMDKGSTLWQRFDKAKEVRDRLTHPKKDISPAPSPSDARRTMEVALEVVQLVSEKVWGKSVV